MSDLIRREDVIKIIDEEIKAKTDYLQHNAQIDIMYKVQELPTVEAKTVVHGEWKRVGSGSLYDTYECTNCHKQPKWDCLGDNHWRIAFTDICPHCGADMRGERHD